MAETNCVNVLDADTLQPMAESSEGWKTRMPISRTRVYGMLIVRRCSSVSS